MIRKSLLLLLVALAPAACAPPPFDPPIDCPKEPTCAACTAQAGCAWCGNECIGIGRKECPPGMVRKPEGCPASAASSAAPR